MFLMDVNVLVYAHRENAANHPAYRQWLESVINIPNIPQGQTHLK